MAPRESGGETHGSRRSGHSPANVTHQLKGIDFPADKRALIDCARRNHAPHEVLEELDHFEEREYGSMADVMKAYGRLH